MESRGEFFSLKPEKCKRSLALFYGVLALLLLATPAGAATRSKKSIAAVRPTPPPPTGWHIVKIGSHDYLTVDNIAEFYGLPTGVEPVEKIIKLENEKGSLQVMLGSRDIILNGVRNWLSFPVIEKDGHYLISRLDLAETIE